MGEYNPVEDFEKINNIIYGQGVRVGSEDYFTIRRICVKYLRERDEAEKGAK